MRLIFPPDEVSERCPKRQEVITASNRGLRDESINCLGSQSKRVTDMLSYKKNYTLKISPLVGLTSINLSIASGVKKLEL